MLSNMMNIAGTVLSSVGITKLLYHKNAMKPKILMYHDIAEESAFYPSVLNVTPTCFEKQLKYLTNHYNVISYPELINGLKGNITLPKHSVALTFDDGLQSHAENAAPLLEKYGCTGTFFVVGQCFEQKPLWLHQWYFLTKNVNEKEALKELSRHTNHPVRTVREGVQLLKYSCNPKQRNIILRALMKQFKVNWTIKNPYLNFIQIKKMQKRGHTIGYHTNTHTPIAGLNSKQIIEEVITGKKTVEKKIRPIKHFAYPFGETTSLGNAEDILKKNYSSAVTTNEGFANKDVFRLSRLSVVESNDLAFSAALEGIRGCAANLYQKVKVWR